MKATTYDLVALGGRMREARRALNLNQVEFHDKYVIGALRTFQRAEMGANEAGLSLVHSFVQAGINANWLLTGEGPMRLADLALPVNAGRKGWPQSFEDIDRKLVINHRTDEKPFTDKELAERPDLMEVRDRLYEIADSPASSPDQKSWAYLRLGRHFGDTVAFGKFAEYQREHFAESMRLARRLLAKEAERVGYHPTPAWSGLLHELLLFGMVTDTGCRTILEYLRDDAAGLEK